MAGRIEAAYQAAIDVVAEDLRETISVPVVRRKGYIERSQPGEPPRTDTGAYLESVDTELERHGNAVTARLVTDPVKGKALEKGNGHIAPRPHIAPIRQKYGRGLFTDMVKQKLLDSIR